MVSSYDGTEEFRAAARALRGADKELRRETLATFRRIAKPLGEHVARAGAAEMPRAGGLADRVGAIRIQMSTAAGGRNAGVTLKLRTKASKSSPQGYDLQTIDAGTIRHPVFQRTGRPVIWAAQHVRPGAFTRPYEAEREPVAREVVATMARVARDIAARSEGAIR